MWNDPDDAYKYSDNSEPPRVCRKCWDTYSNCDCEALRLKQALDEAKKEIKELKKLLKSKGYTTVPSTDPWIACGCPNPDDCEHIFRAPTTPPAGTARDALARGGA